MKNILLALILFFGGTKVFAGEYTAEELYRDNCATCHGAKGQGDGPSAEHMHPDHKPANFCIVDSTDESRFQSILNGRQKKNGDPATMPSWKNALTADQIADLLKYIRNDLSALCPKK